MTREETLKWCKEILFPKLEALPGMFGTFAYVYETDVPYYFEIGFQPYSCNVSLEEGETCRDCPYYTSHGDCYEKYLSITEKGAILFDGEEYDETNFDTLIWKAKS